MASSGLLAALGGAAKYGLAQESRKQDEASEERKLRLKQQLEQQLWEAKTNYAKQNPTYQKFITDESTGDTIGFDEFGGSKLLREASPEERARRAEARDLNKRSIESDMSYKDAQIGRMKVEAETLPAYREALSKRALRPPQPRTPPVKQQPLDEELTANAIKLVKQLNPDYDGANTPLPEDPEYADYWAEVQRIKSALAAKKGLLPQATQTNDFDSLVPSGDAMIKSDLFSN